MFATIYDPEFAHLASDIDYDAATTVYYEVPSPPPMPAKCRHTSSWNSPFEDPFETIEDPWTYRLGQQDDRVPIDGELFFDNTLEVVSPEPAGSIQAESPRCRVHSNVMHNGKCKSQVDYHRQVYSAQNYPHIATPVHAFEESPAEASRLNQEGRTTKHSNGDASEQRWVQASRVQDLHRAHPKPRTAEDARHNHTFAEKFESDAGATIRGVLTPKARVLRQQKPVPTRDKPQQLPMVIERFAPYEQAPHVDLLVGQENAITYLSKSSPRSAEQRLSCQADEKRPIVMAAHSDDKDSIVMTTASELYVAGKNGSVASDGTKEPKVSHLVDAAIDGSRPPSHQRKIGRGSLVGENINRATICTEEQHKSSVPTNMNYERTTSADPPTHRDYGSMRALSISTSTCLVHQDTVMPKAVSHDNSTRFSWAYHAMHFPAESDNSGTVPVSSGGFHPKLLGQQSSRSRWNLDDTRRDLDPANTQSQKDKVATALPAYSLLHRHKTDFGMLRNEAATEAFQLELAFNIKGGFVPSRPQSPTTATSSLRETHKSTASPIQPQDNDAMCGVNGHLAPSSTAICSSPAVLLTKPIVARQRVMRNQRAHAMNKVLDVKNALAHQHQRQTGNLNSTLAGYGNHKFWNTPAMGTSTFSLEPSSIEASAIQQSRVVHPINKDFVLLPFSRPHSPVNHKAQHPDRKKFGSSPLQTPGPSQSYSRGATAKMSGRNATDKLKTPCDKAAIEELKKAAGTVRARPGVSPPPRDGNLPLPTLKARRRSINGHAHRADRFVPVVL